MFLFYPSQRSAAEKWNYVMFLYNLVTPGISKGICSDVTKDTGPPSCFRSRHSVATGRGRGYDIPGVPWMWGGTSCWC
jgi:hypothetical protein